MIFDDFSRENNKDLIIIDIFFIFKRIEAN